jgi:hypothetical protein
MSIESSYSFPEDRMLKSVRSESTVLVDITDEEQWRILFVQGGLTWDFKFIHVACEETRHCDFRD